LSKKRTKFDRDAVKEIDNLYQKNRKEIKKRLDEFKDLWNKCSEEDIFAELVFCLLTPQSKAKVCWGAVTELVDKGLLIDGEAEDILKTVSCVRFKNNKTKYIQEAKDLFSNEDGLSIKDRIDSFEKNEEAREWLVRNVKGMGYKEASHFLRNIGMGEDIAILDRHILKNLKEVGVIKEVPNNLSKTKYFQIENKMKEFADYTNIPISHMDLLFWAKETGEIFK
jgi:N-glycosylase/DNA lyase